MTLLHALRAHDRALGLATLCVSGGLGMAMALERADAVTHLRKVMGATNPAQAEDGTVRKLFGESIERNAIHGSDSAENAAIEVAFFFPTAELA